ncbi:hypothetical protein [Bradyrhizobium sp. 172]|uniref:hypothetical protein n=1 Tax=Bradyrhizobium sp. 172 TaxID=2782643 RepID=UPI00200015A2|nr:hypothetical protein [Bradyrhizobium sp. 172]UPJ99958.1 hypothetical protein IVB07_31580 [Bradyrhizobium sp. 172]
MIRPDSRSNRPAIEIADILRRHGDTYRRVHAGHLGRVERRAMSEIVACRIEALGGPWRLATTAARHALPIIPAL